MSKFKLKFQWLVLAGNIMLLLTLLMVKSSPSYASQSVPTLDKLLLHQDDLPNLYGTGWSPLSQDPEELAREIAQFAGLVRGEADFLEGRGTGFSTYSVSRPEAAVIVQGLYRFKSGEEALTRYEQVTQSLLPILQRETPVIRQSEWSLGGVTGQQFGALDSIESAYAYWFIGVRKDLVMIMQIWICHPFDFQPTPPDSDQVVLAELLPKALKPIVEY